MGCYDAVTQDLVTRSTNKWSTSQKGACTVLKVSARRGLATSTLKNNQQVQVVCIKTDLEAPVSWDWACWLGAAPLTSRCKLRPYSK